MKQTETQLNDVTEEKRIETQQVTKIHWGYMVLSDLHRSDLDKVETIYRLQVQELTKKLEGKADEMENEIMQHLLRTQTHGCTATMCPPAVQKVRRQGDRMPGVPQGNYGPSRRILLVISLARQQPTALAFVQCTTMIAVGVST